MHILQALVNLTPEEQQQKAVFLEKLGEHIRIIRIKKKMRQIEVADRCNFSRSGYNQIENGLRNVSIFTLYKIAHVLDVPLETLVGVSGIGEI